MKDETDHSLKYQFMISHQILIKSLKTGLLKSIGKFVFHSQHKGGENNNTHSLLQQCSAPSGLLLFFFLSPVVQEKKIVENHQDSLFAWRHFGVYLAIMTFSFSFKLIYQTTTYGLKPHSRDKNKCIMCQLQLTAIRVKVQLV